jgi:pimeloyl-ACP methyl ester carboxylesterase
MTAMGTEIRPFTLEIPETELAHLRDRLARNRWPADLPGGWGRGVPVDYLKGLAEYWRRGYDWRKAEARLNEFPQYTTTIDGQNVHFLHVRSAEADATPLMLIHGWPGSIVEFLDIIAPLTDPKANGGVASDAFHLVIPSLPGHALSGPLTEAGSNDERIAAALTELMSRLGYDRYGIQGGDAGSRIGPQMARLDPERVIGVHLNALVTFPSGDPAELAALTDAERERLGRLQAFRDDGMGYIQIQGTRPQTLAYGLTDSPVGQLAWIVEKFKEWTDPTSELPEDAVDRDHLLTNVSLYWFTGTAGSAANLYWENAHDPGAWAPKQRSGVPTGVAVFTNGPTEVAIRRFAEREHTIVRWSEFDRGGHFAALEAPDLLVGDMRAFFGELR